ncbi:conserved protein of unknown function [Bartonella clarridgeiae 73]|uniref:Uncharacterized protein n=1 Tax=Bartonella clarridgeiae (strain CCUG 45776 / CIP 104772 / 73) TaxID=696125 RepID=E6YHF9_BARC7|nr:conserved protein of unknown function [Bartonella clarridgeiae 73]
MVLITCILGYQLSNQSTIKHNSYTRVPEVSSGKGRGIIPIILYFPLKFRLNWITNQGYFL